jgi:hypothetical protein
MPDAYETFDGRFVQYKTSVSGANGHFVTVGPVPPGKVWTVLSAIGYPSVDETQDYWFSVFKSGVAQFQITHPEEHIFDISEENYMPMLREGMEFKVYPGEYVMFSRDGHTAGSTVTLFIRFLETDLPYYRYTEPLKSVVQVKRAHGSVFRQTGGISTGGGAGTPPPAHGATGGGGGGSEPV